jgi:beta-lactamase superfamily II metal-dependent hydrolase
MTTKKAAKKSSKKTAKKAAKSPAKGSKKAGATKGKGQLRVRMYRIGFGDFFLITVPTKSGPQHILIDCGVHAGNIKTMDDCVQDLVTETNSKLALVVATHYHADHLSGFATNFDEFAKFEVGMVWITNRLDPENKRAAKFKAKITTLANKLQMRLSARDDEAGEQAFFKVTDALGIQLGATDKEGGNEKALRLLTKGFKNKPPVRYYQGGDEPELPKGLKGVISAELLAPSPVDSGGEFGDTDNRKEQYLAAAADEDLPPADGLLPFEKEWPATVENYPPEAFRQYGSSTEMEQLLHNAQPDVLLALADALDGTLNNQSLVILFTINKKKLLFVGDAQWGNWSYWLYGKRVAEKDETPGITQRAKEVLSSADFYKVGHHGSTNANPIPAIAALNQKCVSMCSTESADADPKKKRPYGSIKNKSEVPRIPLMVEMEKQTGNRLVRSDWIPVLDVKASPEAKKQLKQLPANFVQGDLYVDYLFK